VPTDGQWHHVAVSVQRTSTNGGQFYVDGLPAGATFNPTAYAGSLSNNAPLVVGALTSSLTYWLGGIDEVEMFNRALAPGEIQAIYSAGSSGKCKTSFTNTCVSANGCISIVNPNDFVVPIFYGFSGMVFFSLGLIWVMWVVMDDY